MTAPIHTDSDAARMAGLHVRTDQLERRPIVPPSNLAGPAARVSLSGTQTIDSGGGFTGTTNIVYAVTDWDNIGLVSSAGDTIWTTPATFHGSNPVWGVHGYIRFRDDAGAFFLNTYQMWWDGPVNDILYFFGAFYDPAEFNQAGYQSDGYAFGAVGLFSTLTLRGSEDLVLTAATIDVVYLGDSGALV